MATKACWVCREKAEARGRKGTCMACHARLYKRFGNQWEPICREVIANGDRAKLLAHVQGHLAFRASVVLPIEPRPTQSEATELSPRGRALQEARRDAARRVIPIVVSKGKVEAVYYFEPYVGQDGSIQVRLFDCHQETSL
jgi:cytochrome c551/c552